MQELGELLVDLGADGARPILALVAGNPARYHIVCVHLMEGDLQLPGNLCMQHQSKLVRFRGSSNSAEGVTA